MQSRHDELVQEMIYRGYNHNSPYQQPDISYFPLNEHEQIAKVDITPSLLDLISRCPDCLIRINQKEFDKD